MKRGPVPLWLRAIACAPILLFVAASCAGLGGWLDEPVGPNVTHGDGVITYVDPDTGGSVTVPVAPGETVEIPTPDGGTVAYTPPEPSDAPTRGNTIASVGGGIIGALLANPTLGVLATAALNNGLGAIAARSRKKTPEVVTT